MSNVNVKDKILGIDTSNYTTSAAVSDKDGNIISRCEKLLPVKRGERGLRQQTALFHHVEELPGVIEAALGLTSGKEIAGVAVSSRPRPIAGSYMPVFNAGVSAAKIISLSLGVPLMEFSHQEGHIAAIIGGATHAESGEESFLFYHLSGGTTEILKINGYFSGDMEISIVGGTLDISAGQLLDRAGVAMGYRFPAGKYIDELARDFVSHTEDHAAILSRIKVKDGKFNLSGIETQVMKLLDAGADKALIAVALMDRLAECIAGSVRQAAGASGIDRIYFGGGVALSSCLRGSIKSQIPDAAFGDLSSDNAAGIAILGRNKLWGLR